MKLIVVGIERVNIVLEVVFDSIPLIHFFREIFSFFLDGFKLGLELSMVLLVLHHCHFIYCSYFIY